MIYQWLSFIRQYDMLERMSDNNLLNDYAKKILQTSVYDVAVRSPLDFSSTLSERFQNSIYLKREDLQPVFSFKLRGAYQKMISLPQATIARGVVTASAGNHAQGVAYSANKLGIPAWIFMPETTPSIKVESVKRFGGTPVLYGDSYDQAYDHAMEYVHAHDLPFIHPYDDPDVIAGQGTIGMELYNQTHKPLDYVFVPVGGGGLLAGICAYLKFVDPKVKIIGVESEESACLKAALDAGERVVLPTVGIFADGVAVKQIGEEPYRIVKDLIDDVITVDIDEICSSIKDIFEATRVLAEPAGAIATAGMKSYIQTHHVKNANIVSLVCGANTNFDRLRHIAERTVLGEEKECLLAVTIPEIHGSFRKFCMKLGKRSITEFNYRYSSDDHAVVFVGLELKENETVTQLISHVSTHDLKVVDLSKNEMAKLHIRYMVGGRNHSISNERLFRFQFPERPGALLEFLNALGEKRNISLFHYRNHGSAFGRILAGIQVNDSDYDRFITDINALGYTYFDESDNPAYTLFL